MFARIFTLLPLALLVSAAHRKARQSGGECDTGSVQCCNSHTGDDARSVLEKYPDVLAILDANSMVGTQCSPVGVGITSGCTGVQQPMCCHDNTFDGLVNLGCNPVTIIT